jgi:hypothetical protein
VCRVVFARLGSASTSVPPVSHHSKILHKTDFLPIILIFSFFFYFDVTPLSKVHYLFCTLLLLVFHLLNIFPELKFLLRLG